MAALEIGPFEREHLDAAAELLAARHRAHRRTEPLLPERYEDPAAARAEIEALWRADDTPGAVAMRGGRLVGYLVGIRKDDGVWGANVWVETAGHAVEDAEDARDLYAAGASEWFAAGRDAHYVLVPASDERLLDAWYRLGFGQQHAFGIRELPDVPWPEGAREAEPRDVDALVDIAPVLAEHQRRSPVFSQRAPDDDVDELRREILEDVASGEVGSIVAEQDGRVVGDLVVVPLERTSMHSGLARPEHAAFLGYAAMLPEARGRGLGVALAQASFAWARDHGYDAMVTDWRVTNLLASRFWPRRGFRPTFYRLYRRLP